MALSVRFSDFTIQGVNDWTPRRTNKIADISIPRSHGDVLPNVVFSGPQYVTLTGEHWEASQTLLRDYFDDLGAKLMNAGLDRLYLSDDDRYLNAICIGTAFPRRNATRAPALCAQFSIEFKAEPFWYAATESSDAQAAIASSPHQYQVTNNGKVRTPVKIHITAVAGGGAKSGLTLTNSTTGLYITFNGSIAESTTLVIDTKLGTCENAGNLALNDLDGTFWLLEAGLNDITYSGPTGVDVSLYWTERFIN